MDPETLKMLGLPPDATEDEIRERVAENAAAAHSAGELEKKLSATGDALKALETEREAERVALREKTIAALDADARGRGLWEPGSERAQHFAKLCEVDLELAKNYVKLLTPQNPVGGTPQTPVTGVSPVKPDEFAEALSEYSVPDGMGEVYRNALRQCKVTPEILKKHGPEAVRAKQKLHIDDWTASMRGEEQ